MYKIVKLQNQSGYFGNSPPTIVIHENDDGWNEAFENWKTGKNPTNSTEWKKGVFALTKQHIPTSPM